MHSTVPRCFHALFAAFTTALCAASLQGQEPAGAEKKAQPNAPANRPNILFAISDDQSFPHCSAYGDQTVKTPGFDRVAKEGVLFKNGFVCSPGCAPSRAAMLTGRYPWQLEHAGTHASEFPKKYHVFPELLAAAGYHVGMTGKGWGPGNFKVSGRDQNPAGKTYAARTLQPPYKGIKTNDYAGNFADFLAVRPQGQPFCFWYGATEPHRGFDQGAGVKSGKSVKTVQVPGFLPDVEEVRSDMLDYYVEIEWFDAHLAKMLDQLDKMGELDRTIVVVTSDNGMAFPRAKANCYDAGAHVPLAVRWGDHAPAGRVVDDLVSLVDLAPTLLEAAGVAHPAAADPQQPGMTGKSLVGLLKSKSQGQVDPSRTVVYYGRERHSSSRDQNHTYPQRAIRTPQYLFVRNFRPERWPAGNPQKFDAPNKLGPLHGGYHDIDACPTLTLLIQRRNEPEILKFLRLAVDKIPAEQLFDVAADPACLNDLARNPEFAKVRDGLSQDLEQTLRRTADPRVVDADGGEIWESYKRFSAIRTFPPNDPQQTTAVESE